MYGRSVCRCRLRLSLSLVIVCSSRRDTRQRYTKDTGLSRPAYLGSTTAVWCPWSSRTLSSTVYGRSVLDGVRSGTAVYGRSVRID